MEVIPELKNTKALTPEQQKTKEGEAIRKLLKDGDHLVLLDEGGREFRSVEYAKYLQQRMASGARRLVFVVGGPYGFSPEIYALAKEKDFALQNDVLPSDGAPLFRGAMLSRHDHPQRRALPP